MVSFHFNIARKGKRPTLAIGRKQLDALKERRTHHQRRHAGRNRLRRPTAPVVRLETGKTIATADGVPTLIIPNLIR
jgi:hypothetical protein